MAIIQSPLWLENSPNHHAQGYRLLLEMLTAGASGVWPNAVSVTETTGAEMWVRVKTNHYLTPYTSTANQGSGAGYNDGDVDLEIAPADGLANRIDLVVFRMNDSAMVGTPNTDDGTLEVVTGTAGGAAPAAPDDALVLAEVLVRAGTSTIEDGLGDITNVAAVVGLPAIVKYTAGSAFEHADYPGLRAVRPWAQGAGGGGGGSDVCVAGENAAARGGNGGDCATSIIPVSDLAASETITVGTGGAGGTTPAGVGQAGSNGGNSSFGAHVVGVGGSGGVAGPKATSSDLGLGNPTNGAGSVGTLIIPGGVGGRGSRLPSLNASGGGDGGDSHMGVGGRHGGNGPGASGSAYGGGGAGGATRASSSAAAGGVGAAGIVIVELIF